MCLSREIRRKWGEGSPPSPIQTLFTGTDQEQQQVIKLNQLILCNCVRRSVFPLVSCRWRWCYNRQESVNTCHSDCIFYSPICSTLSLLTHTTLNPPPLPLTFFFPGPQCHAPGSRPASPQPIRLTRPVLRQSCTADIVLEKPVETGWAIMPFALTLHSNNFTFLYFADGSSSSLLCWSVLRTLTWVQHQALT